MIVLLLVVVPPVGIWLAWRSRWPQRRKVVATGLSTLWLALIIFSDPAAEESAGDTEVAAADADTGSAAEEPRGVPDYVGQNLAVAVDAAETAGYETASHDATEGDASQFMDGNWTVCFQTPEAGTSIVAGTTIDFAVVREGTPCPAADGLAVLAPTVPSVVELSYAEAVERLADVELTDVEAHNTYRDMNLPDEHDDWLVCFQRPTVGEEIHTPETTPVRLSLVEPGTDCPGADNEQFNPEPEPEPDPDPAPDPEPESDPTIGGGSGSSSGSGGDTGGSSGDTGDTGDDDPGNSVYYENCTAVRDAGAAPLYRGQPGYGRHLDRDGDGVACEP